MSYKKKKNVYFNQESEELYLKPSIKIISKIVQLNYLYNTIVKDYVF